MDSSIIKERNAFGGASITLHFNDLGLVAMKTKEISLDRGTYNKIGFSYSAVKGFSVFSFPYFTFLIRLTELRNFQHGASFIMKVKNGLKLRIKTGFLCFRGKPWMLQCK